MFVRNYWNKEGKIYKEVNGGHALRVAEIRSKQQTSLHTHLSLQVDTPKGSDCWLIALDQRRHDPWLQTHHGVDTYTVSCRPDAPKVRSH